MVEGQVSSWELTALPLFSEEMVLVTSQRQEDLVFCPERPLPLLVRDAGEMERHRFEQTFRDAQVEYIIQGTLANVEAIKYCARCGLGVGLIPRGCLGREDGLRILDIPGINLTAQYSVVFHRKRFLFAELVNLIDFLFVQWNGTPATTLFPRFAVNK